MKGVFTIRIYASTSDVLGGNQILLQTLTKKLALKAGKTGQIIAALRTLPSTLPAGSYYLLAEVIDPTGLTGVVATQAKLTVTAPLVKLSATVGAVGPATLSAGKSGTISLTISNSGNITAGGLLVVALHPSSDGTTALPAILATSSARTAIIAGGRRVIRLRVKIPATLAAGSYFPCCIITFEGQQLTATGDPFSAG